MSLCREHPLKPGIDERRRTRIQGRVTAQQLVSEALRHSEREKQAVEMT